MINEFLPFVAVGLAAGAVYGLAGVGLVLTYRTSGVFNFAHGAVATLGGYAFYELHRQHGLPWPVAALICIIGLGLVAGSALELIARLLAPAAAATKVVATVGLLLAIQGAMTVIYGTAAVPLPQYLPNSTFSVVGVNVGWDQLILVVIGIAMTAGLSFALRATRRGIAMRAVVDAPALLELTGLDATSTRRSAWVIGAAVAVASGILIAPTLGVDPILLTLLVVQAFGAAAVGRFRSLPRTFVGGLLIGVGASIGQRYATDFPTLLGLPPSLPFLVLFVVLIGARRGSLTEIGTPRKTRRDRFTPIPAGLRISSLAVAVLVVVSIPSLAGVRLPVFISGAAYVIIFLALSLLLKVSGQISLCHAAFAAVGASTFGHLADWGLPWPAAVIGAGLVALPLGAVVALPAVRLPGVYLALATFGFGLLLERMVYRSFLMFGQESSVAARRPSLGWIDVGSDRAYFYLVVGLAGVAVLLVSWIQRGRLGRLLRGVADSPIALGTFGASVPTALALVCCISAFLAGVGGALLAVGNGAAGATGLGSLQSLLWLTVIAISGARAIPAAVVAAVLLAVLPAYSSDAWQDYQPLAFGGTALVVALMQASGFDWVARVKADLAEKVDRRRTSPVRERAADPGWRSPVAGRLHSTASPVAAVER